MTGFIKILKDPESVCACANQCHTNMNTCAWDAAPPNYHKTRPADGMNAITQHQGAEVETSLCLQELTTGHEKNPKCHVTRECLDKGNKGSASLQFTLVKPQ